jgi:hypothetical protein
MFWRTCIARAVVGDLHLQVVFDEHSTPKVWRWSVESYNLDAQEKGESLTEADAKDDCFKACVTASRKIEAQINAQVVDAQATLKAVSDMQRAREIE